MVFLTPAFAAQTHPNLETEERIERTLERLRQAVTAFGERTRLNFTATTPGPSKDRLGDPFARAPSRGTAEVMDAAELARFSAALDAEDCETAQSLVLNAYLARFPDLAEAFRDDPSLTAWPSSPLARLNPDVFFCMEKRAFLAAQANLDRAGLAPEPFAGWDSMYKDGLSDPPIDVFIRDVELQIVELRARLDHPPALKFLMELGEARPDVLRLDPLTRLVMLQRLTVKGWTLPGHDDLIAAAEQTFPAYVRTFARCWAREQMIGDTYADGLRETAERERYNPLDRCQLASYRAGNAPEPLSPDATRAQALISAVTAARFARTVEDATVLNKPFTDYPAAAAQHLLNANALTNYRSAIAAGDCETAIALVLNAYLKRYPEIDEALQVDRVYQAWRVDVLEQTNPDATFCQYRRAFERTQAALDEMGTSFRRYPGRDRLGSVYDDEPKVNERDLAISDLERRARNNYLPAIRYMLELDNERPDVLRIDPVTRLAYLYYLKRAGERLPDHEARIAAAEKGFSEDDIAVMRCMADGPLVGEIDSDYLKRSRTQGQCVQRQPR